MPKIVDHVARRAEIVSALWRVVQRDGMAGTSVRTVAAEAAVSPGALRHYFTTQDELLLLAVESMSLDVATRVQARLARLDGLLDAGEGWGAAHLDALAVVLEEVMPLDARRRAQFEVWLELVMLARTSPDLRRLALVAHRDLRSVCLSVVMVLAGDRRSLAAGYRDPVVRRHTDVLHGLLDGLCLHLALYPGETSAARVRAGVREHLATLVPSA